MVLSTTRSRRPLAVTPSGSVTPFPCGITSDTIRTLELGMTARQIVFSRMLANPEAPTSKVGAYRLAYSYCGSPGSAGVYVEASRAARHPKISLLVQAIKAENEARNTTRAAEREKIRQTIAKALMETVENAQSDTARLKALQLLGKSELAGFFIENRSRGQR